MKKINFAHLDEPIQLQEAKCNVLVVENNQIYSKIMYSLYNREDSYFTIFDAQYQNIKEKDLMTVFNPLSFNFDERTIKTIFHQKIMQQLNTDIEKKQEIDHDYRHLIEKIIAVVNEHNDIEIDYQNEWNYRDLFKMMNLSVNQQMQTSIFEKIQMIIHTLNELVHEKLLIFTHLNILLSEEEYLYIKEQIDLNSQTVLIIESNQYNLSQIPHHYLDDDFFLSRYLL